ncbi:MAG: GNAT family N-acetyltransferase [Acidobacteria bacterium]|nr:GNAT family N-acetyltransferase [Acidobacteriota bacterium]
MPDMIVHLLNLPPLEPILVEMKRAGIVVRRAQPFEITQVRVFVEGHFQRSWADEISVGYSNKPISIFIATRAGHIIGFAAYECTRRAFFGPMGVEESERGRGLGQSLLIGCLWGLREMGYVYGIIGGAGPTDFYARAVGATIIERSAPGIYADPLKSFD